MNTSSRAHLAHGAVAIPETLREEILLYSKASPSSDQIMSAFRAREGFYPVNKDISNIIQM